MDSQSARAPRAMPAVVLTGARQVGKTTLAQAAHAVRATQFHRPTFPSARWLPDSPPTG